MTLSQVTPGRCVYCGNETERSEHAWPDWVGQFLASRYALPREIKDALDERVWCFCHTCNTKWMANLESRLSPLLKRMMVGDQVTLDKKDIQRLRRWAAKTAISLECRAGRVTASERVRSAVYQGTTRRETVVFLGRNVGGRAIASWSSALYQDTRDRDVYMTYTSIVLEQVFLGVFTDADLRNPLIRLSDEGKDRFIDLVPAEGIKIEWPPRYLIGLDHKSVLLYMQGLHADLRDAPPVVGFDLPEGMRHSAPPAS